MRASKRDSKCRHWTMQRARSIDAHLPPYGTSQNPVDGTAQAIRVLGYSELARLIALSARIDAVVMVTSTRSAETFEREHDNLRRVSQAATKPIFLWSLHESQRGRRCESSARPVIRCSTNMHHCVRAIAAMSDYRARRETYPVSHEQTFATGRNTSRSGNAGY